MGRGGLGCPFVIEKKAKRKHGTMNALRETWTAGYCGLLMPQSWFRTFQGREL